MCTRFLAGLGSAPGIRSTHTALGSGYVTPSGSRLVSSGLSPVTFHPRASAQNAPSAELSRALITACTSRVAIPGSYVSRRVVFEKADQHQTGNHDHHEHYRSGRPFVHGALAADASESIRRSPRCETGRW